jgi:hypothetical protein
VNLIFECVERKTLITKLKQITVEFDESNEILSFIFMNENFEANRTMPSILADQIILLIFLKLLMKFLINPPFILKKLLLILIRLLFFL